MWLGQHLYAIKILKELRWGIVKEQSATNIERKIVFVARKEVSRIKLVDFKIFIMAMEISVRRIVKMIGLTNTLNTH